MKNTRVLEEPKVELLSSTDDESENDSTESDDKHFEFENNTAGEVHKIKRGKTHNYSRTYSCTGSYKGFRSKGGFCDFRNCKKLRAEY